MANVLLLEPNYKNKYPPLGLMKISAYHKDLNDKVIFSKGELKKDKKLDDKKEWDRIYITTLFTFEWDKTVEIIDYAKTLVADKEKIFIGGITATLMPEEIENRTDIKPILRKLDNKNQEAKKRIGYDKEHIIDNYTPDYDIIETIEYDYPYKDAYFAFMTRGCGMNCDFCAVDTLEPDYEPYISIKEQIRDIDKKYGEKRNLLLMDNNVLVSPFFEEIVDEIIDLGYGKEKIYSKEKHHKIKNGVVDFNQGLDANVLAKNEKRAKLLGKLQIKPARVAFDHIGDKNTYIKAIKNCAKHGIRYFSNYMLYNADFVNAKGETYKADAPEDLYKRIRITMDLQEEINKNKSEAEKIKIYSFPMKFIPLKDKDRSYIGKKWNKKFLRAIQVMLLPLHGIGGVSEEFFRKSFGENLKKFKRNIYMPESILMSRGKFLRRDSENKGQWKKRILNNQESYEKYKIYKKWIDLFKTIKENKLLEEFIEAIENNSFKHKSFFDLNHKLIKKIYLFYLSPNQFLLLLRELIIREKTEDIELIYDYVFNDFNLFYKNLLNYISKMKGSYKKLIGFLEIFGEKAANDIVIQWTKNEFKNEKSLENLKKAMYHIGEIYINIDKFRALKRYFESGCLEEKDVKKAKKYMLDLDEEAITSILEENFKDFKEQLKNNNKDEVYYDQIEKKIEVLTSKLGKQISLF